METWALATPQALQHGASIFASEVRLYPNPEVNLETAVMVAASGKALGILASARPQLEDP